MLRNLFPNESFSFYVFCRNMPIARHLRGMQTILLGLSPFPIIKQSKCCTWQQREGETGFHLSSVHQVTAPVLASPEPPPEV